VSLWRECHVSSCIRAPKALTSAASSGATQYTRQALRKGSHQFHEGARISCLPVSLRHSWLQYTTRSHRARRAPTSAASSEKIRVIRGYSTLFARHKGSHQFHEGTRRLFWLRQKTFTKRLHSCRHTLRPPDGYPIRYTSLNYCLISLPLLKTSPACTTR
jgi:hypothetical protein